MSLGLFSFREDLKIFSQSESRFAHGGHVFCCINMKYDMFGEYITNIGSSMLKIIRISACTF
jgi:hypothetical protein